MGAPRGAGIRRYGVTGIRVLLSAGGSDRRALRLPVFDTTGWVFRALPAGSTDRQAPPLPVFGTVGWVLRAQPASG